MPEAIGPYEIRGPLGTAPGSLRGRDTRLGRSVVLRELPEGAADDTDRLSAVIAAQKFSHPYVAAVYDVVRQDDRAYVVCEYVAGESLARVLAGQPLHPRMAALYASQIADGLAEAHAAGLVHGDLRPDTVVITPKGHAKLIEMGLRGFTRGGRERSLASMVVEADPRRTNPVLPYLSPEQALGEPIDPRTDIFSLGAVLYTMLTGRAPFDGATPQQVVLAVMQSSVPAPSRMNPAVPPALDDLVSRALAKSLDVRLGSAAELAAHLRAVLDDLAERAAEPVRPRARRGRRRVGAAGWFALGALAIAGAAAAWLLR